MAIHNIYDHALKILVRTYPDYFLGLTLPNLPVQLVGTQENVELALEIDRVDFLHKITINGDPAYLHVDFELRHSAPFPRRVYVYNGMLTELKKPIPIISVPIYLKPREKEVPKAYTVQVGGHVFHKFTYEPIILSEHVDEIRSGKLYPLAPLLVLLTKNPSQETLTQERDLIVKHEMDPTRRRTLFVTAILTALGQKMFDPEFVWSFFQEEKMLLTEDPVLNRWFNELYGDKLAEAEAKMAEAEAKIAEAKREAEAKMAKAKREAEAKMAQTKREAEAKMAEAEAKMAEAKAKAEKREAEAKRGEAEAKRREAETKRREAELFPALTKYLVQRFTHIPSQLLLDLQRVPVERYGKVMNLALDAPDLTTFQQELKALLG